MPLFITEGSKKVDALISAGARAVVGVIGVWNWRGRNGEDGLAMLPDWEWVALKEGRQVYVVYDSDVMLKEPVPPAMNRLGAALRADGGPVAYCTCRPATAGEGRRRRLPRRRRHARRHRALAAREPRKPPSTSVGVSLPPINGQHVNTPRRSRGSRTFSIASRGIFASPGTSARNAQPSCCT